jgi:hypothetical protein
MVDTNVLKLKAIALIRERLQEYDEGLILADEFLISVELTYLNTCKEV